jgi:peptidoglycan/LPS O-acetylase OafA/YrhL
MTFVYLAWPIRESNVLGVSAIAFGTAVLLFASDVHRGQAVIRRSLPSAALEAFGRLSYELYLFHLIVLGLLRTAFPPSGVAGDKKLLLLAGYLLLSACLSVLIARIYAEPLRRILRRWLTEDNVRAEIEYRERNRTDA